MAEEGRKAVTDEAARDDVVPIAVRAERCLRVVDVEEPQPVEADSRIQVGDCVVERRRARHVDPGRPPVARVEADAEPPVAVRRVAERSELGDRPADRATCSRGVLEAEPELVGRQRQELAERGRRRVFTASSNP